LKKFKGVGPLSYNQLWHALCLCGVLPIGYIDVSAICVSSAPAKLIQIFHPSMKSQQKLTEKMDEVRVQLTKLGFTKITNCFLENMFCEIYRISNANSRALFTDNMKLSEKREVLVGDMFQRLVSESKPTRHPDLYFKNPITNKWQHLFRVSYNTLYMRPSFLHNSVGQSVQLSCDFTYGQNEVCSINISGDYIRRNEMLPKNFFV